jgi:hypothetical protein
MSQIIRVKLHPMGKRKEEKGVYVIFLVNVSDYGVEV